MFRKVLLFSAAMLLWAFCNAEMMMMSTKCGDMSPADCKKEFGMEMDKSGRMIITDMLKMLMMKMMDACAPVKDEMPAGSMHVKRMMEAMDEMKASMAMMDKMDGMDMEEMEDTMERAIMSIEPDFKKANEEDSANVEKFKEMTEKHGCTRKMVDEGCVMIMKEYETMCMVMMNSMRPEDMKEYPEYMEMKEMMKSMMEMTDKMGKMKMMMKMMKKVTDFVDAPFTKAMMNAMSEEA